MAITALSTVTNQILFRSGHIGPDTYDTSTDTIFPGMCVTIGTGGSKDIAICGADDISLGIVGLLPGWDIGTAYPTGTAVPVHTRGSGEVAWSWGQAAGGNKVAGEPLNNSGVSADGFLIHGEAVDEYVGVAYRDTVIHATNDTPLLVHLI